MYSAQLAALSVAQTLDTYLADGQDEARLKWVNDIFISGEKISGVLPKVDVVGNVAYVWIGIGVNINTAPIGGSTCLKTQLDSPSDLDTLQFADLLTHKIMNNR